MATCPMDPRPNEMRLVLVASELVTAASPTALWNLRGENVQLDAQKLGKIERREPTHLTMALMASQRCSQRQLSEKQVTGRALSFESRGAPVPKEVKL